MNQSTPCIIDSAELLDLSYVRSINGTGGAWSGVCTASVIDSVVDTKAGQNDTRNRSKSMIYNELEKLKAKDAAVKSLREHLRHIEAVPSDMEISSVCNWGIYMKDDKTLKDVAAKLTKFRELNGTYEVDGYDLTTSDYTDDKLHVRYKFANGVKVHFYVLDCEAALEVLGQGKCKIVTEIIPAEYQEVKTVRTVKCSL